VIVSKTALASLQRRVRGLHSLWQEAVDTMEVGHVNHYERPGVLPIAFTVHHATNIEDTSVQVLFRGVPPLWHEGGWAARTGVAIDDHGKERTVAEMEGQRIDDWRAYKEYVGVVHAATEAWLDSLDPSRLHDVLFEDVPPVFQKAYVARVVGDGPITLLDGIECWVFQHGIRHLGELEHARALVGLGGLTS
jgi:hypothetical protein